MTTKFTSSLTDLLKTAIESYVEDLNIALPCRVVSYDATKQTADLQPEIKKVLLNTEDEQIEESYPVLPDVPVAFPRAGNWFLSMPVTAGDKMFVVFSSRSLDEWRALGEETLPADQRVHPLNGAVAIPGNLYPDGSELSNAHASNLVLGKDTGARIYVKDDEIDLYEENASDYVALKQLVTDAIDDFKSWATTHAHTGVATGLGTSGPPSSPPGSTGNVGASKVKAT